MYAVIGDFMADSLFSRAGYVARQRKSEGGKRKSSQPIAKKSKPIMVCADVNVALLYVEHDSLLRLVCVK